MQQLDWDTSQLVAGENQTGLAIEDCRMSLMQHHPIQATLFCVVASSWKLMGSLQKSVHPASEPSLVVTYQIHWQRQIQV